MRLKKTHLVGAKIHHGRVDPVVESFRRLRLTKHNAVVSHISDRGDQARHGRLTASASRDVIPLKDNFVTDDLPTTCASAILEGFRGPNKSTVADLLEKAGYAVVAKTNMDEFGMGSHSLHSAAGKVHNGWGMHAQSAGGSSGGSAMAVADYMCRVAIGSDTGGSVRLPAAYCGIVGFKPSYGRISRNGLIPYANSLDTVGILARSVPEVNQLYTCLNMHDPSDPTSMNSDSRLRIELAMLRRGVVGKSPPTHGLHIRAISEHNAIDFDELSDEQKLRYGRLQKSIPPQPTPLRIGVPEEYNIEEMHHLVRTAWTRYLSALSNRGYEIVPCALPTTRHALAAYYVLAPAEASSNLAKYDGVRYGAPRDCSLPDNHEEPLYAKYRGEHFGEEVQRRILLGTFSLSAGAMDNYFIQAQKVRRLVQEDFNAVFRLAHPFLPNKENNPFGVDFIVVPTAPTPPPLITEVESATPVESYMNDVFTVPASLAGLPAISLPVTVGDDMPHTPERNIGMQVIGQFGDDNRVLQFAKLNAELPTSLKSDGMRTWKRKRL